MRPPCEASSSEDTRDAALLSPEPFWPLMKFTFLLKVIVSFLWHMKFSQ